MRKILSLILLSTIALTVTGCLNSDKLSAIQYNNKFVETINATSATVEESTNIYDKQIPNIVTEDSTIEVTALETTLGESRTQISEAESITTLQSRNNEQQTAVQAEFPEFLELAKAYLGTYTLMVAYYKNGEYKQNLDKVSIFDEDLHTQYNDFIASHNKLVDILAEFVK